MVENKFYDPKTIFNNSVTEMTGANDIALLKSFYHSRYTDNGENRIVGRANEFYRNAGAAQLYNGDGTPYHMPGHPNKEYNFISYGNKHFKEYTKVSDGTKDSTYGHSERTLMKAILDDLMADEPNCPSKMGNSEYEILKQLTENAEMYKKYLVRRGVTIKMWSERPSCSDNDVLGGGCYSFIKNIFPEGSCFGRILENYERKDNKTLIGGKTIVQWASEEFKCAFLNWKKANP